MTVFKAHGAVESLFFIHGAFGKMLLMMSYQIK